MFKSKKKDKKEKNTSNSASSYNETTKVQTSNNGGYSSTIITRQISSQSSQIRSTEKSSYSTFHHSSSADSVPKILSSLQTDATPWTLEAGSSRNLPLYSSSSRLPTTSLSSTFGPRSNFASTSANSIQPRSSLSYSSTRSPITSSTSSPMPYRSAFNRNTFGSYSSPSRPPPLSAITGQNSSQNANISRSLQARNEDRVPTYPNNCSKRGKALVINNIKFVDNERFGAEKDSKDLEKFLKKIGFEVEVKKNMKGQDMLKKVGSFSNSNFSNHDISMVVIMSHGDNRVRDEKTNKLVRVSGGYTAIAGVDNVPLVVDDVIEKFTTGNSHQSLRGKPKIFIFQCCRGERDQEVCHDAAPIQQKGINEHTDILIAFSTLPGFLSNRNPETGSWYIQSICEVFEQDYKDHHVEDMLRIVNHKLSERHPKYTQTSPFENRGFKKCYLYPRNAQ